MHEYRSLHRTCAYTLCHAFARHVCQKCQLLCSSSNAFKSTAHRLFPHHSCISQRENIYSVSDSRCVHPRQSSVDCPLHPRSLAGATDCLFRGCPGPSYEYMMHRLVADSASSPNFTLFPHPSQNRPHHNAKQWQWPLCSRLLESHALHASRNQTTFSSPRKGPPLNSAVRRRWFPCYGRLLHRRRLRMFRIADSCASKR